MTNLNPCPVCGYKDVEEWHIIYGETIKDSYWIRCPKCGAETDKDFEENTIRKWNNKELL